MSASTIKLPSESKSSSPRKMRVLLPPAVRSSKLEVIRAAVEKVVAERELRIAEMASRKPLPKSK